MPKIADPMIVLRSAQDNLNNGWSVDPRELDEGYLKMYDEPNNGKRYSYLKIVDGVAQALAIFGLESPIDGIECYSVGYAVNESYRRRGLAIEAINKGIEDLKKVFSTTKMENFYVDAVIDQTNLSSIKVAERIFPGSGEAIIETYSKIPSLHFKKLISIQFNK